MRIKFILTMTCGLLATASLAIAAAWSPGAESSEDKIPTVISGYVTKIDLKKKELTVHGTEVTPPDQTQKFTAAKSFQAPGGGRGGGRGGGSGGRGGAGGRGNGTPAQAEQDFSVNVNSDTIIETEKSTMTLNDLRVQDYVVVLGKSKGKNINASSITVSIR